VYAAAAAARGGGCSGRRRTTCDTTAVRIFAPKRECVRAGVREETFKATHALAVFLVTPLSLVAYRRTPRHKGWVHWAVRFTDRNDRTRLWSHCSLHPVSTSAPKRPAPTFARTVIRPRAASVGVGRWSPTGQQQQQQQQQQPPPAESVGLCACGHLAGIEFDQSVLLIGMAKGDPWYTDIFCIPECPTTGPLKERFEKFNTGGARGPLKMGQVSCPLNLFCTL
jgi:hypothetical protein